MKGHYNDGFGFEWAEVNGSEGSAVYRLTEPNTILMGRHGESLNSVPVPNEFLVAKGSPRNPREGVASTVFRYDLVWEFVSAIVEHHDAVPGFDAGAVRPNSSPTRFSSRSKNRRGSALTASAEVPKRRSSSRQPVT